VRVVHSISPETSSSNPALPLVDDFVSVNYGSMTPYLAGSIRYLKNIIDQQQTTINSLTTTQINLLSRIQALEN